MIGRWISLLLLALWSLLAWPLAFAVMAVALVVALVCRLFAPFHRYQVKVIHPILWRALYTTRSRVSFRHDPQYDNSRPSVFCANHTSVLDAHACIGAINQPFCGLENAAHYHLPIYGWMMRMGNGIAVPSVPKRGPEAEKAAARQGRTAALVAAARERAAMGVGILTFPEGHRTMDGKVHRFRRGAFVMARDSGMPIVPIAVRGMYEALPKGTWLVARSHIDVYVGATIETQGLTDDDLEELAEHVRSLIAGWVEHGRLPAPDAPAWRPTRAAVSA